MYMIKDFLILVMAWFMCASTIMLVFGLNPITVWANVILGWL